MLKRSRWLLLKRPEKLTGEQRGRLAELVRRNLRTVRAYLLKEDFQSLWGYVSPYWAGQFLDRWCTRTMRSRLDPMKEVARMVALAPRPDSELVPSPGAVLQWRCRRLQRKGQSDHQTGVWVPHLRGTGSRFVSRTWRPARTKTHPQILLTRLISEGIHLVTRLKRGIKYGVVETREVNAKRGVTSDETIEFTSAKGRKQCPHRLRRIGYHDRKTGKDYVFLTTHFHLSAKTIADIYKSRWQVELFFKWIKQNLKVKSFVGTSRNAVMTQVWTAMCIYLILSYIKFANRIAWRLSEILRLLQLNLFERRPLRELLGSGNESPPDRSSQLTMKFTWT